MNEARSNGEAAGVHRVSVVTDAKRSPGSQKLTIVSQTLVFGADGRFIEMVDKTEKKVAIEGVSM